MKDKIVKIINIILIIAFVVMLCPKSMQNDTFWSIKIGQELVEEGIKPVDEWSIHSNLKYVAHHFLTDVIIYLVYSIGNFFALYVLEILLALIIAGLFYIANKQLTNNRKISYMFLYIQMYLVMPYIAVRAQMFSTIIFLIQFITLEKMYKEYKHIYAIILAVLPLALAYFHMGVLPFYFVIMGVYFVASIGIGSKNIISDKNIQRLKALFISGLIGLVLSFLNPYGIDGVIYGLKTLFSDTITYNIQEFLPLSFGSDLGLYVFIYTLFIAIILKVSKQIKLKDILLMIGTLFMSCSSLRYVLYYIIFSTVILEYVSKIKIELKEHDILALNTMQYTVIAVAIFFLLGARLNDTQYIKETEYPVVAYENTKQYFNENTRVFNEYAWGSYFMLDNQKVFIDSRLDLYTEEYNKGVTVFKDYLNIQLDYKEIIEKYDINMFFIKSNTALATILSVDNEFEQVYTDDVTSVYIKK